MSFSRSRIRFFISFFAISVASCSASVSSNEPDKMALLALKDEFIKGGSLTYSLNSWNDSLHFCQWKEIICGKLHKRVTILDLEQQKLAGILSHSIGNLTFLKELYLTNNSLHGEIPKQIGKLSRLRAVDLSGNSFQGRIPNEIGNCSNLLGVGLSNNNLTGRIPFEFRSLTKIRWFIVEQSHLTGEMPNFLRNLSSLSVLSLMDNNFYGEIQDSLHGLSKLTSLSLAANNFSGSISSLYNISSLESLDLSRNHFSGTLPLDIDTAFPNLYFFSLFHNHFYATLPPSLTNISGLSIIQLSSNEFIGRIPDYNLGKLNGLRVFVLSDNQLGSDASDDDLSFIDALTNCTKLEELEVSQNRLRGTLPVIVANFTSSLWGFDMSSNYISGPIPEGLGELSGLTALDISDNQFNGIIPVSLGKLSNISELYLSDNNLHGELPSSLGNLTHLLELNLSRNSFSGVIPSALGKCKDMELIYLDDNQFKGILPDDVFSQFQNLIASSLSSNSFSGTFPSVFGKLKALNFLDASHNYFSGQIPSQLGESLSLVSLNLAGNSFDGSIPSSLGNLRGLNLLDLSSNNLSGRIPNELASLVLLQNLNLSFNKLVGEVPILYNASVISVVGNSELCSGNRELQLQPCSHSHLKKRRKFPRKFIIVITLSIAASFSLLVFLCIYLGRRRKYNKDNEGDDLSKDHQRVTYAELFKATEGFAASNLIGTGSFGDVYQGILDGNENKAVAVKVLKLSTRGATKSFDAECKILRRIRHRNLLRIITSCSSLDHKGNDFKALVFDFMSNGNLDTCLHLSHREQREARVPLTFAKRLEIAIDVGCALDYLHNGCEMPIVHCDLKPSNILLDENMVAHVGDFGLAKLLHGAMENIIGSESLSRVIKGSVGYIAPEYGMGATNSTQGDTYSYGILLLELVTGKRPTDEMFNNDTSLRGFIESATHNLHEVIDQHLVNEFQEAIPTHKNPEIFELRYHNLLVSFVEVGLACSVESSANRMDIQSAMKSLKRIKENYDKVCQIRSYAQKPARI